MRGGAPAAVIQAVVFSETLSRIFWTMSLVSSQREAEYAPTLVAQGQVAKKSKSAGLNPGNPASGAEVATRGGSVATAPIFRPSPQTSARHSQLTGHAR